jgi:hypothetical protein
VIKQIKKGISDIVNSPGHVLHNIEHGAESVFGSLIPHFAAGGVMPWGGLATINEGASGETVYLPGGSTVQPSAASSMFTQRAHTPNPAPAGGDRPILVEAYLQMPGRAGRTLLKLVTTEVALKEART